MVGGWTAFEATPPTGRREPVTGIVGSLLRVLAEPAGEGGLAVAGQADRRQLVRQVGRGDRPGDLVEQQVGERLAGPVEQLPEGRGVDGPSEAVRNDGRQLV